LRRLVWISALLAVIALNGCKQKEQDSFLQITVSDQMTDAHEQSVSFGIRPVGKQTADHWRYAASYTRQGKTARFRIDLRISPQTVGIQGVRTGTGSFIAEPNSDNTPLLEDLRQVLKASTMPSNQIRVKELPFYFDVQGENMDRGRNGNLVDSATGNWTSLRLHLGVHQEKEVILNLQKPGGTAEFLSSEPQFANDVLGELAKVL
jgi:hypothetical protein